MASSKARQPYQSDRLLRVQVYRMVISDRRATSPSTQLKLDLALLPEHGETKKVDSKSFLTGMHPENLYSVDFVGKLTATKEVWVIIG